jgi:hypothetical protein
VDSSLFEPSAELAGIRAIQEMVDGVEAKVKWFSKTLWRGPFAPSHLSKTMANRVGDCGSTADGRQTLK